MGQRIIFLDVDGTLVDYEGRLPDSAARANGHRVYICTGRSRTEVYPFRSQIGLDGVIGGKAKGRAMNADAHGHCV